MTTVLVTDGEQRAALAVTRSLGKAGYRVIVTSAGGRSLAGASRYAALEERVPDPLGSPQEHADALVGIVAREAVEVLMPITEASLLAVLPRRECFPCEIPFPDERAFRLACDKGWIARTARELGIAAPAQHVLEREEGPGELPGDPARRWVLKPSRSVAGGRKLTVSYATGPAGVARALAALPAEAFPVLVQERIEGPGEGLFLLRWEGGTFAASAHRRIREKPPSGGVSVLRESAAVDPGLLAKAEALLERLGWRGVAMVEFKVDEANGRSYIMEVNGRFWGSLQLAIDAGVDFPRILAALALGRDAPPQERYRIGVRSRWLLGDVDHLLARLRRSPEELNLPAEAPGRASVLAAFFRAFLPPNRLEVLRLGDPGPFVREMRVWLDALGTRR